MSTNGAGNTRSGLGRWSFWLGVLAFTYEIPGFVMLVIGTMGANEFEDAVDRVGRVAARIWAAVFLAAILAGVASLASKGRRPKRDAVIGIALALLALPRFGPFLW